MKTTIILILSMLLLSCDNDRMPTKEQLPAVVVGIDMGSEKESGSLTLKLKNGELWTETSSQSPFVRSIISSREIGDTIK